MKKPTIKFKGSICLALVLFAHMLIGQQLPSDNYGKVSDKHGKTYPIIKLKDGKWWLAANLQTKHSSSYCYQNNSKNCASLGRLYPFEVAKKVCAQFGKDWHLPSVKEWDLMLHKYGAIIISDSESLEDANSYVLGSRPYQTLIKGGSSHFDAVLAGWRAYNGVFSYLNKAGSYWSASETKTAKAWQISLNSRDKKLYLVQGVKSQSLSVRCVKK